MAIAAAGFAASTYAVSWYLNSGKYTSNSEIAAAGQQPQFALFFFLAVGDLMLKIYSGDPS